MSDDSLAEKEMSAFLRQLGVTGPVEVKKTPLRIWVRIGGWGIADNSEEAAFVYINDGICPSVWKDGTHDERYHRLSPNWFLHQEWFY